VTESITNPELRVFPESLEFGGTQIGNKSNPRQAKFDNSGNTTLQVTAVAAPSAPFEATGLPSVDAVIKPGEEYTVEVTFKPTAAGRFSDSLSVITGSEPAKVVTLSAVGTAPESAQTTPTPELPAATSTGTATTPGTGAPPAATSEPPPALTHLHVRLGAARGSQHARKLLIAYTMSLAGKVELAIDRRTLSRHCPPREHACVRWLASRVKVDVAARAGGGSATLSLAALAAGEYRLDATPLARSGAPGPTQRVAFKTG
jgi:hypothetical protein